MLKQFITFAYGNLVSAAITFFTIPIITLLIIPSEFGKSTMFTLALSFICQIGIMGMDQSFMRIFFEKEEKDRTGLAWLCFIISFGITILIICCLLPFWRQISEILFEEQNFTSIILLASCLLLYIMDRFTISVVRMQKKGNVYSLTRIVYAATNAITVICYAKFIAPTFHAIVLGTAFSSISSIVISILFERKFWKNHIEKSLFNLNEIKQIFYFGLPLVPVYIITTLFQGMDKLALRTYSSFNEIGLYAAAIKIIFPLTIIQSGFTIYWYPLALETYETDNMNYLFFETMFKYMSVLLLITASAILVLKDIIVFILAPAYRSAVQIMPFLILIPFMYIITEVTGLGIIFKKRTYINIINISIAALVNLAGNYFLVPIYGAQGAAFSTGIAYIVYFSFRTYISYRLFPVPYHIYRYLPSFCVLLGFLFINTFYNVPWFANILLFVFIFLIHRKIIFDFLQKGIKELGLIK
jgi:O-antigen/teichoic acid export membrane protein